MKNHTALEHLRTSLRSAHLDASILTMAIQAAASAGVPRTDILQMLEDGAVAREAQDDAAGAEVLRGLCDRITGFAHPLSHLILPDDRP